MADAPVSYLLEQISVSHSLCLARERLLQAAPGCESYRACQRKGEMSRTVVVDCLPGLEGKEYRTFRVQAAHYKTYSSHAKQYITFCLDETISGS